MSVQLTILIGPPCSGKREYHLKKFAETHDLMVFSRRAPTTASTEEGADATTAIQQHSYYQKSFALFTKSVINKLVQGTNVVVDDDDDYIESEENLLDPHENNSNNNTIKLPCFLDEETRRKFIRTVKSKVRDIEINGVVFKPLGGIPQVQWKDEWNFAEKFISYPTTARPNQDESQMADTNVSGEQQVVEYRGLNKYNLAQFYSLADGDTVFRKPAMQEEGFDKLLFSAGRLISHRHDYEFLHEALIMEAQALFVYFSYQRKLKAKSEVKPLLDNWMQFSPGSDPAHAPSVNKMRRIIILCDRNKEQLRQQFNIPAGHINGLDIVALVKEALYALNCKYPLYYLGYTSESAAAQLKGFQRWAKYRIMAYAHYKHSLNLDKCVFIKQQCTPSPQQTVDDKTDEKNPTATTKLDDDENIAKLLGLRECDAGQILEATKDLTEAKALEDILAKIVTDHRAKRPIFLRSTEHDILQLPNNSRWSKIERCPLLGALLSNTEKTQSGDIPTAEERHGATSFELLHGVVINPEYLLAPFDWVTGNGDFEPYKTAHEQMDQRFSAWKPNSATLAQVTNKHQTVLVGVSTSTAEPKADQQAETDILKTVDSSFRLNPPIKMSSMDLITWFDELSFQRGCVYHEERRISNTRIKIISTPDQTEEGENQPSIFKWYSKCRGSNDNVYREESIILDGYLKKAICTCPVGSGGTCKHVCASILEYMYMQELAMKKHELELFEEYHKQIQQGNQNTSETSETTSKSDNIAEESQSTINYILAFDNHASQMELNKEDFLVAAEIYANDSNPSSAFSTAPPLRPASSSSEEPTKQLQNTASSDFQISTSTGEATPESPRPNNVPASVKTPAQKPSAPFQIAVPLLSSQASQDEDPEAILFKRPVPSLRSPLSAFTIATVSDKKSNETTGSCEGDTKRASTTTTATVATTTTQSGKSFSSIHDFMQQEQQRRDQRKDQLEQAKQLRQQRRQQAKRTEDRYISKVTELDIIDADNITENLFLDEDTAAIQAISDHSMRMEIDSPPRPTVASPPRPKRTSPKKTPSPYKAIAMARTEPIKLDSPVVMSSPPPTPPKPTPPPASATTTDLAKMMLPPPTTPPKKFLAPAPSSSCSNKPQKRKSPAQEVIVLSDDDDDHSSSTTTTTNKNNCRAANPAAQASSSSSNNNNNHKKRQEDVEAMDEVVVFMRQSQQQQQPSPTKKCRTDSGPSTPTLSPAPSTITTTTTATTTTTTTSSKQLEDNGAVAASPPPLPPQPSKTTPSPKKRASLKEQLLNVGIQLDNK